MFERELRCSLWKEKREWLGTGYGVKKIEGKVNVLKIKRGLLYLFVAKRSFS